MTINLAVSNVPVIIATTNSNLCSDLQISLAQHQINEVWSTQDHDQLRAYMLDRAADLRPEQSLVYLDAQYIDDDFLQLWLDLQQTGYEFILVITQGDPDSNGNVSNSLKQAIIDWIDNTSPISLFNRIRLHVAFTLERSEKILQKQELVDELRERKLAEARLQYLVNHDDLTGLHNRHFMNHSLRLCLLRSRETHQHNALLLIDVDQFSLFNDGKNYDVGDQILKQISRLLRAQCRRPCLAARIGADQFALLFEQTSHDQALEMAHDIHQSLQNHPFIIHGEKLPVTCSFGMTTFDGNPGLTPSILVTRAGKACQSAKQRGGNGIAVYESGDEHHHQLEQNIEWAPLIKNAILNEQFFLEYQPVMRIRDARVCHYEALIRIKDNDGTIHYPGTFIPVAERLGLINQIDFWVVEAAINFLASLPDDKRQIGININLSPHAFENETLVEFIQQKLQTCWVKTDRITFEITETAAVTNIKKAQDVIARLRALGCRFALDDFGTGFNSFNYVKHFPVDFLKIDGSFIAELDQDSTDLELVKAMVTIAKTLNKETIAEFVGSRETFNLLRDIGVDYVQGHLIGKASEELHDCQSLRDELTNC